MSASPLEIDRSQEKPSLASKRHRQALNPEVLSTVPTSSVKDASPMYTIFFFFPRESQNGLSLLGLSDLLPSQVPKA